MGCIMCFFPCLEIETYNFPELTDDSDEKYIEHNSEIIIDNYLKNRFNYFD